MEKPETPSKWVTQAMLDAGFIELMDGEDRLDREVQALWDERCRLRAEFALRYLGVKVGDLVEDNIGRRLIVRAIEVGMISRRGGVMFSVVGDQVLKSGAMGKGSIRIPYWRPWKKVNK